MEPDDLLCSRNARPQKALVGRAQWKINQPPSLGDNEQAWGINEMGGARRMRAVETTPAASLKTDRWKDAESGNQSGRT